MRKTREEQNQVQRARQGRASFPHPQAHLRFREDRLLGVGEECAPLVCGLRSSHLYLMGRRLWRLSGRSACAVWQAGRKWPPER